MGGPRYLIQVTLEPRPTSMCLRSNCKWFRLQMQLLVWLEGASGHFYGQLSGTWWPIEWFTGLAWPRRSIWGLSLRICRATRITLWTTMNSGVGWSTEKLGNRWLMGLLGFMPAIFWHKSKERIGTGVAWERGDRILANTCFCTTGWPLCPLHTPLSLQSSTGVIGNWTDSLSV